MMDKIDFLPERIRAQRARRQRLFRQGYLLLACAAVLVILAATRHGRIQQARGELAMLGRRTQNVQCQLAMKQDLERQQAELLIKKRIDEHLGSRINALDVLAEICRLLPESMALTSMRMEATEVRAAVKPVAPNKSARPVAAGRLEDQTSRRVRLVLTGVAPGEVDVANFIGQLSASPLLEDVTMGYVKTIEFRARSAREFQASCYVVR